MTKPTSRPQAAGSSADSKQRTQAGKPTISPDDHDENVGQRQGGADNEAGSKQTISSSNHESNVGQRPTRDDGDNDDQGSLK